jgi:hypothetical protein
LPSGGQPLPLYTLPGSAAIDGGARDAKTLYFPARIAKQSSFADSSSD